MTMTALNSHHNVGNYCSCINCGKVGHLQKECVAPITSFGIIAIKPIKTPTTPASSVEYLLVQRKDTMAYVDLVRGKYPTEEIKRMEALRVYADELTASERETLLNQSFENIWKGLWVNPRSRTCTYEFYRAKERFEHLNLRPLFDQIPCRWTETEFGFPKGRKMMSETPLECARREFAEETGYRKEDYTLLSDIDPVEELYLGSNGKKYRHIYYLAVINPDAPPPSEVDRNNPHQGGEIRAVCWLSLEESLDRIRSYNKDKKRVLELVHRTITPRVLGNA